MFCGDSLPPRPIEPKQGVELEEHLFDGQYHRIPIPVSGPLRPLCTMSNSLSIVLTRPTTELCFRIVQYSPSMRQTSQLLRQFAPANAFLQCTPNFSLWHIADRPCPR